jgi:hypothetical protein
VYVSLAPNVGYGLWAYHYATMTAPFPEESRPISFDALLHGPIFELDLAVGYGLSPGVALAGTAGASFQPLEQDGTLGWTGIDGSAGLRAGAQIDIWPSPRGPFHFDIGLSVAAAGFGSITAAVAAPDNVVDPDIVVGPLITCGAQWDFLHARDVFVGLRARLRGGVLFSEHSRAIPVGATAALVFGWF